ncbi:MAG: AtpZ/AtpI family protein [Candidatus Tectomicrobia bacterium]|uniref:AtpZ/AtpI family protein n=1 Tax=Tectimicrobiota bacterium TaxID=2528274 RepID=A0A932CLT2_UNCTE|nr:AtpZ/AtpI family protein [Candidatus Tectomicrobia bacterium]
MGGNSDSFLRQVGIYSTLALEVAFLMAGGAGLGLYLDWWLATSPWLTLTFLLLGLAGGISRLVTLAKIFSRRKEEEERKGLGGGGRAQVKRDREG